ncbi:unnamed protein product [Ostreobium quekettii]|uniref:Uncharacterized protein n=1 Tax=Ostreobium quekettii TaxID=121088 RepID=A0A8S1J8Q1_9CHLO|nr:unnamed protein product [Ostreobium quekettii]|eukprot:evm.model.scf_437EXC.6 EVM.evm.TU.scf_437EXC.6   scf_437EXC:29658-30545(-)
MQNLRRGCLQLVGPSRLVATALRSGATDVPCLRLWTTARGSGYAQARRSSGICGLEGRNAGLRSCVNSSKLPIGAPRGGRVFSASSGGAGGGGGISKTLGGGGGGGGEGGGGVSAWVAGVWAAYLRQLEIRPVITKMWTSGLLNGFGDALCQGMFNGDSKFDFHRFVVFTGLGVFLVGPALHYWYTALTKIFTVPGTKGVLGSLALDQLAFAPTFCGVFISILMTLEGQTAQIPAKLKQDWFNTVVMNWKIWVPAQLFNFWLVPPTLRVLCANITALVWNVYLSFASHIAVEETK